MKITTNFNSSICKDLSLPLSVVMAVLIVTMVFVNIFLIDRYLSISSELPELEKNIGIYEDKLAEYRESGEDISQKIDRSKLYERVDGVNKIVDFNSGEIINILIGIERIKPDLVKIDNFLYKGVYSEASFTASSNDMDLLMDFYKRVHAYEGYSNVELIRQSDSIIDGNIEYEFEMKVYGKNHG